MTAHADFTKEVSDNEARFADLSARTVSTSTDQNYSHVVGAMVIIALGGFMNRRLAGVQDSLVKAAASVNSTDLEEAASAKLVLASTRKSARSGRRSSVSFSPQARSCFPAKFPT